MNIKQALNLGYKKTKSTLDAEVLLSHVVDKPKEYLFSNLQNQVLPRDEKKYFELATKRQLGWPVAYLVGKKEFFDLEFFINKNVLIPRPETECLVEVIINLLLDTPFARSRNLRIVDIGTGSGNIIISLVKALKKIKFHPALACPPKPWRRRDAGSRSLLSQGWSFYASDISGKALAVAKKNAKLHKVKINFRQGDLLKPWNQKKFDVIIANLPYGWKEWKNNTSAATIGLKFEPARALFTKKNGLHHIGNLLKQIAGNRRQMIFLEFDPRQTSALKLLIKKYLPQAVIKIYKDLSRRNRFAQIRE